MMPAKTIGELWRSRYPGWRTNSGLTLFRTIGGPVLVVRDGGGLWIGPLTPAALDGCKPEFVAGLVIALGAYPMPEQIHPQIRSAVLAALARALLAADALLAGNP